MVKALADRELDATVLGPGQLFRLRTHSDPAVAASAVKAIEELKGPETKEKDALIAKLQPEVVKPGSAANGAKVFKEM